MILTLKLPTYLICFGSNAYSEISWLAKLDTKMDYITSGHNLVDLNGDKLLVASARGPYGSGVLRIRDHTNTVSDIAFHGVVNKR